MRYKLDDEMILPFSLLPPIGFNKMEDIKDYVKKEKGSPTKTKAE